MENLQSLGKGVNLGRHFIPHISYADDILEKLVLALLEVVTQALNISKGVLTLSLQLVHLSGKSIMLLCDHLNSVLKHLG